jgi:hypothetical protein
MISAYFASLGALDLLFVSLAVVGASLLLVRTVMMLAGIGHHDVDISGVGGHFDVHFDHGGDVHSGDSDSSSDADFRLFSLQTLTAFFLIAGLAGLAFHRGSHLGAAISVLGALAAGALMMVVIAWLLSTLRRLQTSGTIDLRSAVGEEGTVY